MNTPVSRRRLSLVSLVILPVLAFVALVSWGLSGAVGSSPDDDFHLASIWCGHGDSAGCTSSDEADERVVYRDLVIDSVCYAFNADQGAGCQGDDYGQNPHEVVQTPRGNFDGLYPPVFYFVMSQFAGEDIEASVLVMRVVNAALFVGLVSVLFWLLPVGRRQTLVWSLAVTLIPLGLSLIASTNPSSWAIISAGILLSALLGFFESTGARRIGLGAIAAIAVVMAAGSRADAALYSGLAIVLALTMSFSKTRAYLIPAAFVAALGVVAGLFFLSARQGAAVSEGLTPGVEGFADPLLLTVINLVHLPSLWAGALGFWNLGWLDTAMPSSVWFSTLAAFFGAIYLGIATRLPRKSPVFIIMAAALVVVPLVLLVQSSSIVGANVQPRYILPLMMMFVTVALLQGATARFRVRPVVLGLLVSVLSIANAVALHTTIRRYVTGADVASVNLNSGIEWWWDLPISPMAVWVIGSLAFAGVLTILATSRLTTAEELDAARVSEPAAVRP